MKKANINLLPTATRFQLSNIRIAKKLKKIALISVLAWSLIALVVFSVKFLIANRQKALAQKKEEVNQALERLSPQTSLQQALRFRVKLVAEVIEKRPSWAEKVKRIVSLLPNDATVRNIVVEKGETEISGNIFSLAGFSEFEKKIALAREENSYYEVKLRSLSQSKNGWTFSLLLVEK